LFVLADDDVVVLSSEQEDDDFEGNLDDLEERAPSSPALDEDEIENEGNPLGFKGDDGESEQEDPIRGNQGVVLYC
jgi:hypothetical protein